MKKALSVLAVLALAFSSGCGPGAPNADAASPPPSPSEFSANMKIVYRDGVMSAELNRRSKKEFVIKILEPEILAPLEISYLDGSCTVTYDGLEFETDSSRFPQTTFGSILVRTLESAQDGKDVEKTFADGVWTYRGTGENGAFVLTQNEKTGEWLELEIEDASLRIVFSDFRIN